MLVAYQPRLLRARGYPQYEHLLPSSVLVRIKAPAQSDPLSKPPGAVEHLEVNKEIARPGRLLDRLLHKIGYVQSIKFCWPVEFGGTPKRNNSLAGAIQEIQNRHARINRHYGDAGFQPFHFFQLLNGVFVRQAQDDRFLVGIGQVGDQWSEVSVPVRLVSGKRANMSVRSYEEMLG